MRVYLGEEDGKVMTEPARPIAIQQLLTHTSGLTYGFMPTPLGKMYAAAKTASHPNLEAWSKAIARQPLVAQPGSA